MSQGQECFARPFSTNRPCGHRIAWRPRQDVHAAAIAELRRRSRKELAHGPTATTDNYPPTPPAERRQSRQTSRRLQAQIRGLDSAERRTGGHAARARRSRRAAGGTAASCMCPDTWKPG